MIGCIFPLELEHTFHLVDREADSEQRRIGVFAINSVERSGQSEAEATC
jgi:hypothetical protein